MPAHRGRSPFEPEDEKIIGYLILIVILLVVIGLGIEHLFIGYIEWR